MGHGVHRVHGVYGGAGLCGKGAAPLLPPPLPPRLLTQVVEWAQALTPAMQRCQGAITEILDSLIKDLKRTNKIDW